MAKFRCCGNRTTEGHADDCSLKPPTMKVEQGEPKPQTGAEVQEKEEGCQFDILHFKHIGECKGTCGEQEDGIAQYARDVNVEGRLTIVLIDLSSATEEDIQELEKRGLRRLTEEEMTEILDAEEAGELEVNVLTITLEEAKATFPRLGGLPKEDPNPFLTIREAAEALQFSESWVRRLCAKERLEGALKLNRRWAIPRDAIYEKEVET